MNTKDEEFIKLLVIINIGVDLLGNNCYLRELVDCCFEACKRCDGQEGQNGFERHWMWDECLSYRRNASGDAAGETPEVSPRKAPTKVYFPRMDLVHDRYR